MYRTVRSCCIVCLVLNSIPLPYAQDVYKSNITIGFLGTFNSKDSLGKLIAGAVPLAVDEVNNRSDLLPNHTLRYSVGECGEPNTPLAIRRMTSMREEGVVAFIGPEFNCAAEGLVAAAWHFPMITYKCSDRKVSNKEQYSTFARTMPPSSKISKSVVSLLIYYKWYNIVLLVAEDSSDKQIEEALIALAREHGIRITHIYYLPKLFLSRNNNTIAPIIEDSYRRTRVYVVIADIDAVFDFARVMYSMELLDSGDYVIITVLDEEVYVPNSQEKFIQKAYESLVEDYDTEPLKSVLMLTLTASIDSNYDDFVQKVTNYSGQPPFNIPYHPSVKMQLPYSGGFAYDAVMVYARALTEVLAEGGSEYDGEKIISKMLRRHYDSILGYSVMMDENGDAEGNYTVLALFDQPHWNRKIPRFVVLESMQPVGQFSYDNSSTLPTFHLTREINWLGEGPTKNEPLCGFDGRKCDHTPDWKVIIVSTVCAFVIAVAAVFAFRHYRYELKLACLLWKVELKDIVLLRTNSDYTLQSFKTAIHGFNVSRFSALSDSSNEDATTGRTLSKIGFYKGNVVFLKHVYKRSIDLTRGIRKEMIEIKEMRHENINPFIGACVDPPNICILKLYTARGSLEEVLRNEDLDLDAVFVASLVSDLIKGMIYLHDSEIISHGNLKSSNCLVDSRWVLQITDFGLHEFQCGQELTPTQEKIQRRGMIWRAPELLRMINPPARGTQKGDVYSFAIILYEIMGRAGPWGSPSPPVKYIIERVTNGSQYGEPLYRPPIQNMDCADYILCCMEECWNEEPELRPDFRFINIKLREMQSGLKPNIFDNMLAIMEKYSYNLEGLVQERTNQLMEEKKKTENLLLRMLPKSVAEQLKRGEPVEAESFDAVTIYFSDIVGFTALSAISTPLQVVDLLNDLYTCFDSIIEHYDVYKVETIGDAYMVVSGLPIRNGVRHAGHIASMAIHLLAAIHNFEIKHLPGERLKLRIGIHSGPCVAGVVGLKMPRYCLFGDTVNTASRMESTGEALKIHVSEACKNILDKLGGYVIQERGLTPIKGKGQMRTYWLLGHADLNNSSLTVAENGTTPLYPSLACPIFSNLAEENNCEESQNYGSCLTLFQQLKKDLTKESKRDYNCYRSAPIITFRDYSPRDYIL